MWLQYSYSKWKEESNSFFAYKNLSCDLYLFFNTQHAMIIPQSLSLLNLLKNWNYILTYFIRGQIPEPKEDQYVVTPVHPGVQTKWVQSKLKL